MLWLLLACLVPNDKVGHTLDPDGDGFGPEEDCAPLDAAGYPGADEVWYDGVDQDCDGGSDYDQDGDGFGSAEAADASGQVGPDCDDEDGKVYPGAKEVCDERDNDCDGDKDEGAASPPTWYTDADGDGFGGAIWGQACAQPSGTVAIDGDCNDRTDDSSAAVTYPGAEEVCGDGVVNDCGGEGEEEAREECSADEERSLAQADLKIVGESSTFAGSSVSGVGDVDKDGRVDLLVGAMEYGDHGTRAGAVHLLLSSGALADVGGSLSLATADLTLVGEDSFDYAGSSGVGVGDLDGDGGADFLVGAPGENSIAYSNGAAYLLLSSELHNIDGGILDLGAAHLKFVGESEGDEAGIALSSIVAEDADDDTYLIVGASGHSGDGAVYFILASSALATGESVLSLRDADIKLTLEDSSSDNFGFSVSGGGDVDGDGHADVLVGSHSDGAYLLLSDTVMDAWGKDAWGATLREEDIDCRMTRGDSGAWPGYSVSIVGDIDDDGYADIAVGDPGNSTSHSDAGVLYLLLSSGALRKLPTSISLDEADFKLLGENKNDNAGHAVATAGDVDGDGLADLLVGSENTRDSDNPGAAYLLLSSGSLSSSGSTLSLSEADLRLYGESGGDEAGSSVAPAGDVNGDGFDDLLIGAPYNGDYAGAAYLLYFPPF